MEHRPLHPTGQAAGALACRIRHEPAPVGVGEEDVVVLGQEPRRGRGRGIGSRGVRDVEELAARLVAEHREARP